VTDGRGRVGCNASPRGDGVDRIIMHSIPFLSIPAWKTVAGWRGTPWWTESSCLLPLATAAAARRTDGWMDGKQNERRTDGADRQTDNERRLGLGRKPSSSRSKINASARGIARRYTGPQSDLFQSPDNCPGEPARHQIRGGQSAEFDRSTIR